MWTKLELDGPKTGEVARIREELAITDANANRDPAKKVIADFLSKVKEHLISNLDCQYGTSLWRNLPITLVVTFPAVWSDSAKDRTLQAVPKAGFNENDLPMLKRIVTITEPEAATIYTMKSLRGTVQEADLQVNDGFVLCDLGGGTADLISYRIASMEPTIVEEATVGTGDQCEGSFVDRSFLFWLEERLGTADFTKITGCPADQVCRTLVTPKLGKMLQEFTVTAKSGFSGEEEYYLRLPAPLSAIEEDERRGICDGEIRMRPFDLMRIFEGPVDKIVQLIGMQLEQAENTDKVKIKYIFMVGGFAESPYMYRQIKLFGEKKGLQVIKPTYPWSAVVRGAVAKGLEGDGRKLVKNSIKTRICRRSYGTACNYPFVSGKHRIADSYLCPFTGQERAADQMNWLLRKGQKLSTAEAYHGKLRFHWNIWPGASKVLSVPLLAADSDGAPPHSKHHNIYKVAELVLDLSAVPKEIFQTKTNKAGQLYHYLEYEVEISVQASLEFSLFVNGKRYGSVTAAYAS